MSIKPLRLYGSADYIQKMKDEHEYIGRNYCYNNGPNELVITTRPPKFKSPNLAGGDLPPSTKQKSRKGNGFDKNAHSV